MPEGAKGEPGDLVEASASLWILSGARWKPLGAYGSAWEQVEVSRSMWEPVVKVGAGESQRVSAGHVGAGRSRWNACGSLVGALSLIRDGS